MTARGVAVHTGCSLDCAAALVGVDGHRTWLTPDDPGRCAITRGGTPEEASAAVVEALRESFAGDWSHEATPLTEIGKRPCARCARRQRYSH